MTGALPEQIVILIAVRDSFEVQVFKKPFNEMDTYIGRLIEIMKKNILFYLFLDIKKEPLGSFFCVLLTNIIVMHSQLQ